MTRAGSDAGQTLQPVLNAGYKKLGRGELPEALEGWRAAHEEAGREGVREGALRTPQQWRAGAAAETLCSLLQFLTQLIGNNNFR